jgi:hypothetical protein
MQAIRSQRGGAVDPELDDCLLPGRAELRWGLARESRPEGEVGLDGPEASRSSKRRRTHSHGSEGHENRDNLYLAEVTQRHRAAFVSSQRRWMIHPITANRIHAAAAITD